MVSSNSDFKFDLLVFPSKAILATQFDAFEKGKLVASSIQDDPITENLRNYVPLPIAVLTGSRSF